MLTNMSDINLLISSFLFVTKYLAYPTKDECLLFSRDSAKAQGDAHKIGCAVRRGRTAGLHGNCSNNLCR
jgi:hypothetical protein